MMHALPILAHSEMQYQFFVQTVPWINAKYTVRVTRSDEIRWRAGFVIALPGWDEKDPKAAAEIRKMTGKVIELEHIPRES